MYFFLLEDGLEERFNICLIYLFIYLLINNNIYLLITIIHNKILLYSIFFNLHKRVYIYTLIIIEEEEKEKREKGEGIIL